MATVQVTEKTLASTIKQGIVVLDFWAPWCGPCRTFAPTFEAAAARHPDVVFGKVNTEEEPGLAAGFGIRAIPTVAVLRDGVLLALQPGMLPAAGLDELVEKVRALDMVAVRKSIEPPCQAMPKTASPAIRGLANVAAARRVAVTAAVTTGVTDTATHCRPTGRLPR